jgi:LysM repeat protein
VGLALAALALFLLPSLLGGGTTSPSATPTRAVDVTPEPTRRPQQTARAYTVKEGDTLSRIARRFGITVEQLQCANRLQDVNLLSIGQEITIPAPGDECLKGNRTPRG